MGNRRRTIVQREVIDQKAMEMSWEEASEMFLESLKIKGLAYHTRRWHKENLVAVVKVLRALEMADRPALVTEGMIKQVVLKMIDNELSPTTINHRVRSVKQLFEYLKTENMVTQNPAANLDRRKPKTGVIETFTEEQLKSLLACPDKTRFVGLRDYTIMLLLLDTGVRISELVNIKLVDLRMIDNEIIITQGKGGKSRRVYISPKTKETLKRFIQARGDISGNPYLLVSNADDHMTTRNVQERLRVYGDKAHIEGVRVSPHTFRHTFAKMYIMRGGDPFSLQALLGHSTLDMVKHYVNIWGSDLQKMHRQFSPVNHLLSRDY